DSGICPIWSLLHVIADDEASGNRSEVRNRRPALWQNIMNHLRPVSSLSSPILITQGLFRIVSALFAVQFADNLVQRCTVAVLNVIGQPFFPVEKTAGVIEPIPVLVPVPYLNCGVFRIQSCSGREETRFEP